MEFAWCIPHRALSLLNSGDLTTCYLAGAAESLLELPILAQIIPLGERHLRHALKEYTEHYPVERNHQGIDNKLIDDRRGKTKMSGDIEHCERIGGVLNHYRRAA